MKRGIYAHLQGMMFIPLWMLAFFTRPCRDNPVTMKCCFCNLLSVVALLTQAQTQTNRFADPLLRQLFSAGYHRNTDSLLAFFQHENAVYRKEAALFFASWHDSTAITGLGRLLDDPDKDVRMASAFSMGQMGIRSAGPVLISRVAAESDNRVKRYLLEAIGQCASDSSVAFLAAFQARDSVEEAGVAWGLYRATGKKIYAKAGSKRMAHDLQPGNGYEIRHAAAYYFSQLDSTAQAYADTLISCVLHDPSPNVRLGILRALRKVKRPDVMEVLVHLIHHAADYRIRVDALMALRSFSDADAQDVCRDRLAHDSNVSVRITAAETVLAHREVYGYEWIMKLARREKNIRIKTILLNAALPLAPDRQRVLDEARKVYGKKRMSASERKELANLLKIKNDRYFKVEDDSDPRRRPHSYAEFDWRFIANIPPDCKVRMKTSRGSFVLRLLVEEAPFTVAHFLSLMRDGALTGLEFYRVIPNFVNQTGGPVSPGYEQMANTLIRSEFKIRPHAEGSVNMASNGPDTESSHFSIMLRSTPWNDYHYTVFAEITEGMDIVNRLQLGDQIEKVEVL